MGLKIWTSIKRWWENHRWVDTRDYYILSHKNEVFYLTDWSQECANIFKKENPSRFYQYCFTPGPIGVAIKIIGGNNEQDITDYESW